MNENAKINEITVNTAQLPAVLDPQSSLLMTAISAGASPEMLRELVELQKSMRLEQSRQAFYEALAAVRGAALKLRRNKQATGGTKHKYATLDSILDAIGPVMAENGLSVRHKTETAPDGRITVTCIIAHRGGYEDSTSLSAMPDTGPGRNAIQSVGSSVTYLRRYTLESLLGLAEAGEDDDGAAAQQTITAMQYEELNRLIERTQADVPALCRWLGVDAIAAIPAASFGRAKQALEKKLGA